MLKKYGREVLRRAIAEHWRPEDTLRSRFNFLRSGGGREGRGLTEFE
ncbi:hypothetical protein [Conexivisphaera calida]|uniref:Uncharacterized protein n=1 Tax=Conexivisphaera calida TaxID=1874277 RepID=A0A4P2VE56_9ARCH|nr:hypothetical protein [Conexivisphaera calida]BBE41683.1 hypothetical protein NAS2_0290 [Conexivisphaera calida]